MRQPIVSVLGHVDHGKTTLLDYVRGTSVAAREAGLITQHIGATEVPIETIKDICGKMFNEDKVRIPGLLFIDTPGHRAFTSMRARGGGLADLAVLMIDVVEGIKPQTIESIEILKRHKTPFVIAANKVDRISGWRGKGGAFLPAHDSQPDFVQTALEQRILDIIGKLYEHDINADRFDRIEDFTKNFAIIPMSAKHGEGIPDLLMMLIGLSQRFLGDTIEEDSGPGEGTVLEVKEEVGLGTTIDVILYKGMLRKGDDIAIGGIETPVFTRVKAILKPKALDEIRDPRDKFLQADEISAAAGVKVLAPDLGAVVAGSPIKVVEGNEGEELCFESCFEAGTEGVTIKADTLGSLEALQFECRESEVPILRTCIGPVSRSDVMEVSARPDPLEKVILSFNVGTTQDAVETAESTGVKIIDGNVIYKLIEDYLEWKEIVTKQLDEDSRIAIAYPAKVLLLPDCFFRLSKPAIVGVRILAGTLRPGLRLMREDGRSAGLIRSIRSGDQTLQKAGAGDEVAIAIDGVTCGRQIKIEDVLYVDIPEHHVKELRKIDLSYDEEETLEKIIEIKRKDSSYWGM